ncbi:hypothetical protein [Catenuloplanes atrovinosus]|uniref:Uncharacterized protein n=1 Tax=Catenuloplanes atrovinosus TaxID=137266 RepID=A0AAE3YLH9_9ACTN|nr:hypothetical protein [Catenuloplanes atrovinosus]MDR7274712.1 hypothetical protein [Catenuloplanes atrovinosus]
MPTPRHRAHRRRGGADRPPRCATWLAGVGAFFVLDDKKGEELSAADAECRLGATGDDGIADTPVLFDDDQATRLSPTLDFDEMNGSVRYARHCGRTY